MPSRQNDILLLQTDTLAPVAGDGLRMIDWTDAPPLEEDAGDASKTYLMVSYSKGCGYEVIRSWHEGIGHDIRVGRTVFRARRRSTCERRAERIAGLTGEEIKS